MGKLSPQLHDELCLSWLCACLDSWPAGWIPPLTRVHGWCMHPHTPPGHDRGFPRTQSQASALEAVTWNDSSHHSAGRSWIPGCQPMTDPLFSLDDELQGALAGFRSHPKWFILVVVAFIGRIRVQAETHALRWRVCVPAPRPLIFIQATKYGCRLPLAVYVFRFDGTNAP